MDHTDTKRIIASGDAIEFYVLRSPHILIRELNVKFCPSSNGEYFDMSYEAIEKKSNAHVRPQPKGSISISKEEYLILMRSIGDRQNVGSICLQYLWPSDKLDSVFPGLFLSCSGGFTQLCRALCTNRTMSTLQIQLSGKAPGVIALSQGFDTNVSFPSQLLTIDPAEKRMMEVAIAMKVAIKEIAFLLCHNKALQTIQIQSDNNSDQDWVKLVRPLTKDLDVQQADVQQQSHVDLAKLHLTISGSAMPAAVCNLAFHEVFQSSTLKELTVETSDHYGDMLDSSSSRALLQALVRPLIADEAGQEAKVNLSKLTLVLPHVRVNASWSCAIFTEILPELLQRNSTLKELTVKAPHFYEPREEMREEKLCALLQSLKENKSLEILDLSECQGILTQRVIPTLMDILLVNFTLRDINFGDSSIWYGVKEQLRKNEKYMQSCLRTLPVAKAQAARVFLCGGPYAGKTTLRKILIRCSEPGSKFRKTYLSPCKDLMIKSHDGIQKIRHGRLQLALRTRGIEIWGLKNNAGIRLSIWDMGGQEEYHAFHDFMFPNLSDTGNPSSFLLVCNPFTSVYMDAKKQPEVVSEELKYWLRFIASNTRKSVSFKPKVHVVLTHADKVAGLAAWAKGIVTPLQKDFCGALDLSPEPIAVNARSSRSSNSIASLIQENTQAILEKLPHVYEVCSMMRLVLADWRLQNPECPLISWQTFSDLCQDAQVPDLITYLEGRGPEYLLVEGRRKAVAECLHDAGDIIFFNDFDLIVVDLNWFCHRVMGHLIRLSHDKFKDHSSMGSPADRFIAREYLEAILNESLKTSRDLGRHGGSKQSVKAETLVKLMLRLELCFEKTTGSLDDGLFIPMTLARESECLWHWPTSNHNFQCNITKVVHFGRRLQCDDQKCTFIPPGLFCRLQVSLHNKFLGPSNHMTAHYFLEKDLILIVFNGVEIVLEYHGNVGTHIDVLVRSNSMSFDDALEIVHEHVMTHVQELCVSSGGCQGVLLVEGIVRPECVRQQMSFMQRQNQGVLVEDLKRAIEASGSRMYQHTWIPVKEGDCVILDSGCEGAMDLLGSKEKEDVKRRLPELRHSKGYDHTMNPLGGLTSSILEAQDSSFPKPMFYGESSKVLVPSSGDNRSNVQYPLPQDPTSSHPDIYLQRLEDLSIQIRHLEERLCPMTQGIIDLFLKSSQRQVPCIVLFTKNDASMKQRLVTKFVPGMKALRLHLLCEYKTHVHKVQGKHGCEVILQEKEWEEIHGLVVKGLKWVFLAIKMGAHITMGIGDLVPNPSKAYAKAVSDSVGSHLPIDWATVTPEELEMDAASAVRTAQKESAEQWLVDFLKDKCILKKFGLQRVRYKDEQTEEVGWICEEHLKKGEQTGQLARLPRGGTGL
ncbi:unnamed protein product [Sphagnum troendelagicum]|uniref:C-terminal of Roc (COR) domain-containing protein n=1 Tax=Sphagnum troendelagicum TaxID=128251 RepID=A0ABP0V2C0_9BRYO